MQTRISTSDAGAAYSVESDHQRSSRLLPGPLPAAEQAALDAAISTPSFGFSSGNYAVKARVLVGTAAIAVAVTIPDLSLGAMGSPYMRVDVSEPIAALPGTIWSPSAGSTGPVYAQAMAAEELAPTSLTFSDRPNFGAMDRALPLNFLETGSERFDLAFAGVELPTPVAFSISAGLPDQPAASIRRTPAVMRPRLVDIPQISGQRIVPPASSQSTRAQSLPSQTVYRQSAGQPRRELSASALSSRELAIANEAIEAAFAGTLDLSGGVRETLPGASVERPETSEPASEQASDFVPMPVPEISQSASGAGLAELVQKTQLDARVNGVLTGSVDFQQRDGGIAIRLGSVVDMLQDRFSASELAQLQAGTAGNTFINLVELQAAGIPISYDPVYDEVSFGIDYEDAAQADKVQVEQIGAPTIGSERTLMDQISR